MSRATADALRALADAVEAQNAVIAALVAAHMPAWAEHVERLWDTHSAAKSAVRAVEQEDGSR